MNQTLAKTGIIAIVDDDAPLREALGSVLKAAGFVIDTFASAEEFLEAHRRNHTSCLILDVHLPGMSGVELQRRLLDANYGVPIIFVTAHGDGDLRDLEMERQFLFGEECPDTKSRTALLDSDFVFEYPWYSPRRFPVG